MYGHAKQNPARLGWLSVARVTSGANAMTVTLPVPPRLLEEPAASTADLGI